VRAELGVEAALAAVRLLSQGRSIREVSRALGYASEPAFSRAFTRRHGRPPSTYFPGRPA
jgi:AraC-like DNA-binding protein